MLLLGFQLPTRRCIEFAWETRTMSVCKNLWHSLPPLRNDFPLGLSLFSTFFFFSKTRSPALLIFQTDQCQESKTIDKWGHLLAGEHITKVNRKESGFWYHVENGNPGSSDQEVGKSVPSMRNAAVEGPCESRLSVSLGTQSWVDKTVLACVQQRVLCLVLPVIRYLPSNFTTPSAVNYCPLWNLL